MTSTTLLEPDLISAAPPLGRGIFCNRTLNMRSIRAVGYDMDYTLIHYRMEAWERRAYEHTRQRFKDAGWPVTDLHFDPGLAMRGLVLDVERGNVLKANRFGYVKRAFHGTTELDFDTQRDVYARTLVDLSEPRYVFLNTLFSISEACLYMQLVDLLDARRAPEVVGYPELYLQVRRLQDAAHMEGQLKAEIVSEPERFLDLDPETPLALLDQKESGKKLLLITNSEWDYTRAMMAHAFDRFLPAGMGWRDLFDVVIVSARKPEFFTQRPPAFQVVSNDGLLRPLTGPMVSGGLYLGGHAAMVEKHLGLSGDDVLYVGDHIFTDVHISKSILRWRTALVLRELEDELAAVEQFRPQQARLDEMMAEKERLEFVLAQVRLQQQRQQRGYGPPAAGGDEPVEKRKNALRAVLAELDARIAPLAKASGELLNLRWGPLMRTGNDKSHLARQVERYADIYTSRVSNFLYQGPYVYLRSPRGSLPHDRDAPGRLDSGAV